jgi:hypothetical protein
MQLARLETAVSRFLADLVNISRSGAMIQPPPRVLVGSSESVRLILLDGTQLHGRVVWSTQGTLGLRFDHQLCDPAEHLDPEYLGANFFVRILRLQRDLSRPKLTWSEG